MEFVNFFYFEMEISRFRPKISISKFLYWSNFGPNSVQKNWIIFALNLAKKDESENYVIFEVKKEIFHFQKLIRQIWSHS